MSNKMTGPLYDAVHQNHLLKVKKLVHLFGLSHRPEWCDGYYLLLTAIEKGHSDVAKFLLKKGVRVNLKKTDTKSTPLHLAVGTYWDQNLFELLLDNGANVEARDSKGKTPLHVATKKGNFDAVCFLVKKGAKVDTKDDGQMTPLLLACFYHRLSIAEYLLKFTGLPGKFGLLPLHLASWSGNKDILRLLIIKGHDLNVIATSCIGGYGSSSFFVDNILCFTPLLIACKRGHFEIVKLLLEKGADGSIASSRHGYLPLHLASMSESVGITQLLLEKGADPNALSKNNLTPLLCACKVVSLDTEENTVKIVELLFSRSADVNSKYKDNNTALSIAVKKKCPSLVECILKQNPDISDPDNRAALKSALCGPGERNLKIYRRLLEYGFSLSCEDANDPRFLHFAIKKQSADIVRYLINNGADPDSVQNGATPLHLAVQSDGIEIVKILLDARCNVNVKDESQKVPIDYTLSAEKLGGGVEAFKLLLDNNACVKNSTGLLHEAVKLLNVDICKMLIAKGVDVNAVDEKGSTALRYTILDSKGASLPICGIGELDAIVTRKIALLLLESGCDINAKSREGWTILRGFSYPGLEDVVNVLLERTVNINSFNSAKKTLLHLAAEEGHLKIVENLLKHGAEVNCVDNEGNMPLHCVLLRTVEKEEDGDICSNIVSVLLSHGAEVNHVNGKEDAPLHIAIRNKSLKVVKSLIKHNANVNVSQFYLNNSDESDDRNSSDSDCDCYICRHDDFDSDYDYEYDISDSDIDLVMKDVGLTPLHHAAKGGEDFLVFAEILLENGAKIDARSKTKFTPLHLASIKDEKMVELLLNRGADINAVSRHGLTPLHVAAFEGCSKIVKILLQFNASIDHQNSHGETALHLAAQKPQYDTVVSAADFKIFLSTINKICDTVGILLDHGADISLKTRCGKSARDFTEKGKFYEYDDEDDVNPILFSMEKHCIKLKTTGFYESLEAHTILYDMELLSYSEKMNLEEFLPDCKIEFEEIKDTKLCCHVSLCDILNKSNINVDKLSRNKILMQTVQSLDLKMFPIYGGLLKCTLNELKQRSGLLVSGCNCFDFLVKIRNKLNFSPLPILPAEVKLIILSFLTNGDLRNFTSCFNCFKVFNSCPE